MLSQVKILQSLGVGYFFESHCTYGQCYLVALRIFIAYYAAN